MNRAYQIGDLRLHFETETEISVSEKIRRGVRYSAPKRPCAEMLELEHLRDQALAARIKRAAKRNGREVKYGNFR